MSGATSRRDRLLHMVREERTRQDAQYGEVNETLALGFGDGATVYPWLLPYSDANANQIEAAFRADYGQYESDNGTPTWMHLIREEVSELFASTAVDEAVAEAIQVAALCVSLAEKLLDSQGDLG
jgi:hypothetical protein